METPDDAEPTEQWPEPLDVSTVARASQVRVVRRRLTTWLHGDHLDEDAVDDLVMAASEALENCCDHAYGSGSSPGTMRLAARTLDDGTPGVLVLVEDGGRWQPDEQDPGHRGRGLAMMRTLVDDVTVETGPAGTRIELTRYAA